MVVAAVNFNTIVVLIVAALLIPGLYYLIEYIRGSKPSHFKVIVVSVVGAVLLAGLYYLMSPFEDCVRGDMRYYLEKGLLTLETENRVLRDCLHWSNW